jgi:hypothetical protein
LFNRASFSVLVVVHFCSGVNIVPAFFIDVASLVYVNV